MKFLIDECLHASLVDVAQVRGHEATHVCFRGWSGWRDDSLMEPVVEESFTFVTNNTRDFLRLFALQDAHAGLVILLPNVEPPRQRELFEAALEELGGDGDLFNQALQADFREEEIELTRFDLAAPEE